MPDISITLSAPVAPTSRMRQVAAIFDAPIEVKTSRTWTGRVPIEDRDWQIGLIVGPSGAGKSTIARELFGPALEITWPPDASVIDSFDAALSVEQVSAALSAVGFNTIPAWLRPYGTLSNGEKFRCDLARLLLEPAPLVWIDEFTSVVDRQVARIGAHACARFVRSMPGRRFVAVGCHYDVIDWLQPDWVLEPADMTFAWRSLQRRPTISGVIRRAPRSLWPRFAPYHYMSADLSASARCFALEIEGQPIAFCGILPMPVSSGPHRGESIDRVSRIVVLPDWQGCGTAFRLLESLGSAYTALGRRFRGYPAAPNFIAAFRRKPLWREIRSPSLRPPSAKVFGRPCATFEYAGPALDRQAAERLLALG